MKKIMVLHGPNLNLLGTREPLVYGNTTLNELNQTLISNAEKAGVLLSCQQSNCEGELINIIHEARERQIDFIIFNPAALTHTSIALRDALNAVTIPFIEVHISNIYSRETFRHRSFLADLAIGTICGLGIDGYFLALTAIIKRIRESN